MPFFFFLVFLSSDKWVLLKLEPNALIPFVEIGSLSQIPFNRVRSRQFAIDNHMQKITRTINHMYVQFYVVRHIVPTLRDKSYALHRILIKKATNILLRLKN